MKRLANIFLAACSLLALAAAPACSDSDTPPSSSQSPVEGEGEGGGEAEAGEPIGCYFFDGEEYPIYSAGYTANDAYLSFIFSPLRQRPFTTSLAFALATPFIGKECDVMNIWHNDDYMLVYEDPVHYYSYYRALKSGTLFVERNGEEFVVRIDVKLADGTPLKLDYSGPLAPASPEEE